MLRVIQVCDRCKTEKEVDLPYHNVPKGWTIWNGRDLCTSCTAHIEEFFQPEEQKNEPYASAKEI